MSIDAVPVQPDPSGTDAGTESGTDNGSGMDAPVRRLRLQEALGAEAWPGYIPKAPATP